MEYWLLALIVKPFAALVLLLTFAGMRYLFIKYLPESRFKRFLLLPVFKRQKPRQ